MTGGSGSNQPYGWRPYNNAYSGPNNTSFARPSNNSYPQQQQAQLDRLFNMEDTSNQFMQVSISNQKNTDASIKNLEVQVGQLAKQLFEHGSVSFSAQVNPKEHCNLIATRWGAVIGLNDNNEEKIKKELKKKMRKMMKW